MANRPDIIIKNRKEKKCILIDVAILRMWNVKTNVTPVIIGTTGTISKSSRK
jgi:RNase P/RNase MRP subunit POP5